MTGQLANSKYFSLCQLFSRSDTLLCLPYIETS